MNFLKKFGSVILNVASLVPTYGALLKPFLPSKAAGMLTTVSSEISTIASFIGTAEGMINAINSTVPSGGVLLDGSHKLAAATPFIATVIKDSELMIGKKVADEAKFTKACQEITSAFADLLSSLEAK